MGQFLNLLATSIINAIPEKSDIGTTLWNFIKTLRPVITFDNLTGAPQASFEIKPKEVEANIDATFRFLDQQTFKTVIAIDEFQQILRYPEKNTDAWLRTRIQQLKNVTFIFSGSQQHLMAELFTSPKRPFYRSSLLMKLNKINIDEYARFIVAMFGKYKKSISPEIAREIINWANTHTFYVQQLCNRVFAATPKVATSEIWKQQAFLLLKEQETLFFSFRNMLTYQQWRLLKAIANEEKVYQPTAKSFLTKHQLGTSATVLRSLKSLQDYELIYREFEQPDLAYYCVYDVYFQQWCKGKLV
jgi:hypothetical protein